jgi:hypothetical protein
MNRVGLISQPYRFVSEPQLKKSFTDPTPITRKPTRFFCAAANVAQTTLEPKQIKEWPLLESVATHFPEFYDFAASNENGIAQR